MVSLRWLLALGAVACAAWLASARFAIGLDFQGGAMLAVKPHGDVDRVVRAVRAARPAAQVKDAGDRVYVELEDGNDTDAAAIATAIGADGELDSTTVIAPTLARWRGRPLACALALAAALAWLAALRWPRAWPSALVGTFALVAAASVILVLALGGTLSQPLELAGGLLGIAALPAARPRAGTALARLASAWPAGILFALVGGGSLLATHPASGAMQRVLHAARYALPLAIALAAMCALATAVPQRRA
jgi:hypothetical protein